jgi:hypothetical protein
MLRVKIVLMAFLAVALVATTNERGHAQSQGDLTALTDSFAGDVVLLKAAKAANKRADAVDATDNPCTTSAAFVDLPGMTRAFSIAGRANDEVVVLFQGEWIPNTGRALLRLAIDGVVVPGPGDAAAPFAPHEGTGVATEGFNFFTGKLVPGGHTAKIQWASADGAQVCVDERSMVILHK